MDDSVKKDFVFLNSESPPVFVTDSFGSLDTRIRVGDTVTAKDSNGEFLVKVLSVYGTHIEGVFSCGEEEVKVRLELENVFGVVR